MQGRQRARRAARSGRPACTEARPSRPTRRCTESGPPRTSSTAQGMLHGPPAQLFLISFRSAQTVYSLCELMIVLFGTFSLLLVRVILRSVSRTAHKFKQNPSDAAITWAAGQGRQGPLRSPARALSLRRGLQQQSLWRRRYPTEPHIVTTSDGYIMQMDRIPRRGARSPPLPLFFSFNTPPSFASALHAHPHPACVTLLHR